MYKRPGTVIPVDDIGVRLLHSLEEALLLAAATVAVPLIVYTDSIIIGNGVSEYSITEVMQDALILLSMILFWNEAWRCSQSRGFLMLVGGFFACMFIRELDFLFDMVHHGFWLYPALLTALVCMAYTMTCRKTVLGPMAAYADTKSGVYVYVGLLIVVLFSRIFGSGRLIWIDIMGSDYKGEYKTIIQEGLELFGYVFVFYGSCLLPRTQ